MPWRVGTYLANQKKGALAGPIEVLGPSAALFYGAQFVAMGVFGAISVLGFDGETWLGKLAFWLIFYSGFLFEILLFHGFLKAFGSSKGFTLTLVGISYAASAWFLATAVLFTLHLGLMYRVISFSMPSRLRWWEWGVEFFILIWIWFGGLVLIQSKIHQLPWYRVAASAILAGIGYGGWVSYFIQREYLAYVASQFLQVSAKLHVR